VYSLQFCYNKNQLLKFWFYERNLDSSAIEQQQKKLIFHIEDFWLKKLEMATQRDREILNAIVNPLLPIGESVFDDEEQIPENLKDSEQDTQEYRFEKNILTFVL
jgi:hypothetical protein